MPDGEVDPQLWADWNISVMAIGGFYSLCFLVLTTYYYFAYRSRSGIKLQNVIVFATIIHIATWFIHFTASMTTYMTEYNRNDEHDNANYTICVMIILHPCSFYTLMTSRIYYGFQSSTFKLNKYEFGCIAVGFLGTFGATLIEQVSWILIIDGGDALIDVELLIDCLWTYVAFDIITRLLLVYLFVSKLMKVVLQQSLMSAHEMSEMSSTRNRAGSTSVGGDDGQTPKKKKSVVLTMQQMRFMAVIKKITLLGVAAVLPIALSRLIFAFDFVAKDGILTHEDWITFNTLQMVAVFIEILSIFLSFRFSEPAYFFFCKYCDIGCGICCKVEAKRRVTKATSQEHSVSPPMPRTLSTAGSMSDHDQNAIR